MTAPENHITVSHGSMTVNIPRDLFKGPDVEIDPDKEREFREMLGKRYPWLSKNSLDVLMRNARKEMLRVMDEESGGRSTSKRLSSQGKNEMAIAHLEQHLKEHPDDADSWYALGELLCKVGRAEEGYKAMKKGRSLF